MENKILKPPSLPAILSMVLTCTVNADTTTIPSSQKETRPPQLQNTEVFSGKWSYDCKNTTSITANNTNSLLIQINLNQIYINALSKLNGNTLTIFLDTPEDLGLGGMQLDWQNFSRRKPIAYLQIESAHSSKFTWNGFYNNVTNSREWTEEPDFVARQNPVTLERCY